MASFSNPAAEISSQIAATTANAVLPGAGALISGIESLFTGAHAAAVAKEASTINNAIPAFLNQVSQTIAALNAGAITPTEANSYLQQAQDIYYQTTSGIIKKGGTCTTGEGGPSISGKGPYPSGLGTGAGDKNNCNVTSDPCNAACCLGCDIVEPAIRHLTAIVNAGGGTYAIPNVTQNGQIKGAPAVTLSYTPSIINTVLPASVSALIPATIKANPLVWGVIALLAIVAFEGLRK